MRQAPFLVYDSLNYASKRSENACLKLADQCLRFELKDASNDIGPVGSGLAKTQFADDLRPVRVYSNCNKQRWRSQCPYNGHRVLVAGRNEPLAAHVSRRQDDPLAKLNLVPVSITQPVLHARIEVRPQLFLVVEQPRQLLLVARGPGVRKNRLEEPFVSERDDVLQAARVEHIGPIRPPTHSIELAALLVGVSKLEAPVISVVAEREHQRVRKRHVGGVVGVDLRKQIGR